MRSVTVVLQKELRQLYATLTAYVLIAIFMLVMGYSFTSVLFFQRSITMVHALAQAATLMLLFIPLLTMRQFSEERRSGALDLLLSSPVREVEIVAAKFIAGLSVLVIIVVLSLVFPITLALLGQPDYGAVIAAYLGLLLLGASLLALGLMVAAWIDNPLIAAAVSLGLFLLLWMIEVLGGLAPPPLRDGIVALSFDSRFSRFLSGAVYASDCGYFLLIGAAALVMAVRGLCRR